MQTPLCRTNLKPARLVIHLEQGRPVRADSDDPRLTACEIAVVENGHGVIALSVRFESEIGTYVQQARAATRLLRIGCVADVLSDCAQEIAGRRYESPAVLEADLRALLSRTAAALDEVVDLPHACSRGVRVHAHNQHAAGV